MTRRAVLMMLWIMAFGLTGCVMHAGPPGEVLVVVSRRVEPPDSYELRVIQPEFDREAISAVVPVEHAMDTPLPIAIAQDGAVVLLAPAREQAATELRWVDSVNSVGRSVASVRCAQLLESCETRVGVIDRAPEPRAAVRFESGRLASMNREYVTIDVFDIDRREQVAVFRDVFPLCRVEPGVWLALREHPPALVVCGLLDGSERTVGEFDAYRWISGIAVAPNGAWVCIASQPIGASWNLHRLDVWMRDSGRLTRLVPEDVYVANLPDSPNAPVLTPTVLSDRHLAVVATQVTRWQEDVPIDGRYGTLIFDIPSRKAIARIVHPRTALGRTTPPPYLPEDRLRDLRIRSTADPALPQAEFRRYFTVRGDSATGPSGRSYPVGELTLWAAAASRSELAVRRRFGGSGGMADEVILIVNGRERTPIAIPRIERMVWLPRRPISAR